MKPLMKIAGWSALTYLGYVTGKFVLFSIWPILIRLFTIVQTMVMVAVVMTAFYVLWKILGAQSSGDRD